MDSGRASPSKAHEAGFSSPAHPASAFGSGFGHRFKSFSEIRRISIDFRFSTRVNRRVGYRRPPHFTAAAAPKPIELRRDLVGGRTAQLRNERIERRPGRSGTALHRASGSAPSGTPRRLRRPRRSTLASPNTKSSGNDRIASLASFVRLANAAEMAIGALRRFGTSLVKSRVSWEG